MPGTTIDYTAYRKGRKTPDGPIIVCPKCGRKGAVRTITSVKKPFRDVTHKKHQLSWSIFWHVDDYCFVPIEEQEMSK
jgi:hypothetical protein